MQRLSVYFRDALRCQFRIDHGRDVFIGLIGAPLRALHNSVAVGDQLAEFNLCSATEPLLSRAIFHLERKAQLVQARVHRLVENRRRNFGVREVRVDRERQLHQAGALLVKVGAPAREALDDYVSEVSLEVAEVVWDEALYQLQRSLESSYHFGGVDVGTRVVDHDRNAAHIVAADRIRGSPPIQEAKNLCQHEIKIVFSPRTLFN